MPKNKSTRCYDYYNRKIIEGDILQGQDNSVYSGIKGMVVYDYDEKLFTLLNRDELYYLDSNMSKCFIVIGNENNNPDIVDDLFSFDI